MVAGTEHVSRLHSLARVAVPEPVDHAEFIVVGAGLLGLAAARALSRRDRDVIVLEQDTVGHRRGGSHGASRIFRYGYTDERYVRMALLARELWHDLEVEVSQELLRVTGQCSFGPDLDELLAAMHSAGAPATRLSATAVAAQFPEFAGHGAAVYEPGSAVMFADRCLGALRASAACEVRTGTRVLRIEDRGSDVEVVTAGGSLSASVAIVCPGPWSRSLLAGVAPVGTFATQEHVAYVRPRDGALPDLPIFIAHERPAPYGLPTPSLGYYKLAFHHAGNVVDPTTVPLEPRPDAVAALEALARSWLPSFEPEAVTVETCLYDNTADEHFVLDRRGRVVVGAGTSGHGFKFGPLLGEVLADLATGSPPRIPLDGFTLARHR
jgi:sarcosine oxidase